VKGPKPARWWETQAQLRSGRTEMDVRLLARAERPRAATVWVCLSDPRQVTGAVEAVVASRMHALRRSSHASVVGSANGLWVDRAYRRRAAGTLLLKGGVGDSLRAGLTAAMDAGFTLFALTAPRL
jgi:hypothetical protein